MLENENKNNLKHQIRHVDKFSSPKKQTKTEDSQNHLLNSALNYIEKLYRMRFIQKISRPIQKRVKQQYVEKFAGKMENLHNILERIKQQLNYKPQQEINTVEKSIAGSTTYQQITFRISIKKIQSRYIQVFRQGSFKYYSKLYQLNGFNYTLTPINIQQWSLACLNHDPQKKKTCC